LGADRHPACQAPWKTEGSLSGPIASPLEKPAAKQVLRLQSKAAAMPSSTTLADLLEVAHGRAIFGSVGIAAGVE